MHLNTSQVLEVLDGQDRAVGQMTVETKEGNLLSGKFIAGPAFPSVAEVFRNFEEAVNSQALGVVAKLDSQIARLGLRLRSPQGAEFLQVHDVQIWSDGGMSCRLSNQNGAGWE